MNTKKILKEQNKRILQDLKRTINPRFAKQCKEELQLNKDLIKLL